MPDLWLPGAAEPSLDRFVDRVHAQIERYTSSHAAERSEVEVELADGERLTLQALSPEPGYGFLTLIVHPENDRDPQQLIVPVGSIRRISLGPAEGDRIRFGFSPRRPSVDPDDPSFSGLGDAANQKRRNPPHRFRLSNVRPRRSWGLVPPQLGTVEDRWNIAHTGRLIRPLSGGSYGWFTSPRRGSALRSSGTDPEVWRISGGRSPDPPTRRVEGALDPLAHTAGRGTKDRARCSRLRSHGARSSAMTSNQT